VTVPVAAVGESVAVNVTFAFTEGVVVELVSVVVLEVFPFGASQKLPQPPSRGASPTIKIIHPVQPGLIFIESPCLL
jgi:hypothetical protein